MLPLNSQYCYDIYLYNVCECVRNSYTWLKMKQHKCSIENENEDDKTKERYFNGW